MKTMISEQNPKINVLWNKRRRDLVDDHSLLREKQVSLRIDDFVVQNDFHLTQSKYLIKEMVNLVEIS